MRWRSMGWRSLGFKTWEACRAERERLGCHIRIVCILERNLETSFFYFLFPFFIAFSYCVYPLDECHFA